MVRGNGSSEMQYLWEMGTPDFIIKACANVAELKASVVDKASVLSRALCVCVYPREVDAPD